MTEEDALRHHADEAARAYDRLRPDYQNCATKVQQMMTAWLDEASINYESVSARAKTRSSLRRKSSRPHSDDPSRPKYRDPLTEITDLIGARVITYLPESVDRTCEIVQREFEVIEHQDKGQVAKGRGLFGYASKHFLVRLDPARAALAEYKVLKDKVFEIQVRTASQHAWAEFEHDVRYKVAIPPKLKPEFDRRFLLAAALMELADAEFTAIDTLFRDLASDTAKKDRLRSQEVRNGSYRIPSPDPTRRLSRDRTLDTQTLMNWLAERYPDAPKSKTEHYAWMVEILRSLDLREAGALEHALGSVDSDGVVTAMRHKFPAGQVRRLDDDLLAALGERYIDGQPDPTNRRTEVLRARALQLPGTGS